MTEKAVMNLAIPDDCKFSMLAIHSVRADISKDGIILPDGTLVLTSIPLEIDVRWKEWLGSTTVKQLGGCNVVFLRIATTGWSADSLPIMDEVNEQLGRELHSLFAALRLLGQIEYDGAFQFDGYLKDGQSDLRSYSKLEQYRNTGGYFPWLIREADLRNAFEVHQGRTELARRYPDGARWRVWRGYHALNTGLQSTYGSDRLHNFIRALEALILPEPGKTEKQFVARCLTFGAPKSKEATVRTALQEAYRMRSDVEHVHEWDRSLVAVYGATDCSDIALLRTRQMEMLACWAYTQIFSNPLLQSHFDTDTTIDAFWRLPETDIRAAFGASCDTSTLPKVSTIKLGWNGTADPSEWPRSLFKALQRTA